MAVTTRIELATFPPSLAGRSIHSVLNNCAEFLQGSIWISPCGKHRLYCLSDVIKSFEIAVVYCQASCQFPDAFDWIQLRAVRRQKQQRESARAFLPPGGVKRGMMVTGIVCQYQHLPTCVRRDSAKLFHKTPEGLSVKDLFFSMVHKFSIA